MKIIALSYTSSFISSTRVNECNIIVLDFWKPLGIWLQWKIHSNLLQLAINMHFFSYNFCATFWRWSHCIILGLTYYVLWGRGVCMHMFVSIHTHTQTHNCLTISCCSCLSNKPHCYYCWSWWTGHITCSKQDMKEGQ